MKHQGQRAVWAVALALAASAFTTGCTEQSATAEPTEVTHTETFADEGNVSESVKEDAAEESSTEASAEASQLTTLESGSRAVYDEDDMTCTYKSFDAEITLSGNTASVTGDTDSVTVSGSDITITKGGTYHLSGTLTDGQLSVTGTEKVKLYFDGVSIANNDGAAVLCTNEKRTIISLADGTENTLTDGGSYTILEDDSAAALYAKDKLTINGTGKLTVNGTTADGIVSKDDLKVTGGTIIVDAVNNGIKGTDSLSICGGTLDITAGNDALKSSKADNTEKGWVAIDGGEINAAAGGDGIQAETTLEITAGTVNVTTSGEIDTSSSEDFGGMMGGGMGGHGGRGGMNFFQQEDQAGTVPTADITTENTSSEDTLSSKGLKSGGAMAITGGDINVSSTDHCVHSGSTMELFGGTFSLSSSLAKGISSHGELTISGDKTSVTIDKCTEGIESKSVMNINGGNIRILNASDDGLNTGGTESSDHTMNINGGTIYINGAADGTDSNGDTNFNGGILVVSGPTDGGNGSLDGDGTMTLNGGLILALSSRGMMEYPAGCMMTSAVSAADGDMISVLDTDGNLVIAMRANKNVSDVIFADGSGEDMTSYKLVIGGTFEGTLCEDGWAIDGALNGGSECSWSQTGSASGGMMGGFGGGMHGGMRDNTDGMTPPEGFGGGKSDMPRGGFGGADQSAIPE